MKELLMFANTISIFLISALLLSSSIALAQKSTQPADSREVIKRMTKELGLNESQRTQVETILNNEKKKVEAVFNEERMKLQSIQEETRSSLQAILTPEQMQKLDKKMQQGNNKSSATKK